MSSEQDAAADWTLANLCPGCCTLDDIPEFTPSAEVLTPLVECTRCDFRFPVLPAGFKQFTLDALHHHDCSGDWAGDWQAVGQGIVDAIRESVITGADLAERFNAMWPANAPGS